MRIKTLALGLFLVFIAQTSLSWGATITGSLSTDPNAVGMFPITITDSSSFSATTLEGGKACGDLCGDTFVEDPILYLFDSAMNGVVAHDDIDFLGDNYQSHIEQSGLSGLYYLFITRYGNEPLDSSDNPIFDMDNNPLFGEMNCLVE